MKSCIEAAVTFVYHLGLKGYDHKCLQSVQPLVLRILCIRCEVTSDNPHGQSLNKLNKYRSNWVHLLYTKVARRISFWSS
jgi:hypothetical protein